MVGQPINKGTNYISWDKNGDVKSSQILGKIIINRPTENVQYLEN